MKSHNNQNNEVTMGIQPTKIQLYGRPQGNEFVYGKEILRQLGIFEFDVVGRFKSSKEAHQVYRDWMKENEWNYAKPIVGWDNGPVTIDSWEK